METGTLILVMGLCITLVCLTQVIKSIFDRMDWVEVQLNALKDSNANDRIELNKFYTEVMGLLSDQHNEMRDARSQFDLLENRVKEDEDDNCDNFYTVHSQLHAMDGKIKKNEEACYHIIKDNTDSLQRQVDCLRDLHSNLACAIAEHNKTLNEIRTEMLNKMEEKEENE